MLPNPNKSNQIFVTLLCPINKLNKYLWMSRHHNICSPNGQQQRDFRLGQNKGSDAYDFTSKLTQTPFSVNTCIKMGD